MHAARMPEWRAVRLNASARCVLAGDPGEFVAAGPLPSRGPLSLSTPGALFPTSGVATAQRTVRIPENLPEPLSRSSPDPRSGTQRIENGAGPQGARWAPAALSVLS
jgi:hypothetical protein